jgi:DNA invertase Pin-like site-specific DNA recombinase
LFVGTNADNMRDKIAKGRQKTGRLRGSAHGRARLTEAAVVEIRKRHADGASVTRLAQLFHVGWATVRDVVKRKNWRHVP